MDNRSKIIFFPNLNSLRFIAALLVIIHHIEQLKSLFFSTSHGHSDFIQVIGKLGVVLFFVLSGFLITYLLLSEKDITGTIKIKNFYVRRILRIWPLYFLIVLSALFIFPHIDFFRTQGFNEHHFYNHFYLKLALFVFLLPNLALSIGGTIPYASHTWSIGVEEQFYLFWPFIIKYFKNKLLFMSGVIVIYLLLKYFLNYHAESNENIKVLSKFWNLTPIDCMAIGGIFSYICYSAHHTCQLIKAIIFKRSIQVIIFSTTVVLIGVGFSVPVFQYEFYAILFGIIISNLALNEKRIISLELKPLNYLGKISYGLYMFHPLAIIVTLKLLERLNLQGNFFIYAFSLLTTISISALSYHFFEKWFIRQKVGFSTIVSGDNVKSH